MGNLFFKISYGLYVACASLDGKDNGCMTNSFIQQTDSPYKMSVTLNKGNLTHDMIRDSGKAVIAVLSQNATFDLIKNFGFQSGRTADKFSGIASRRASNGILVPTEGVIGYFELELVNSIDMGTHTQFVFAVTENTMLEDAPELTYKHYQTVTKPTAMAALANDKKEKETEKGDSIMAKFVCTVCGYVHEGDSAPDFCPVCKVPASKFVKQSEEMTWAAEHVIGVASDVAEDIKKDLRANFEGECCEVGMYLAMARAAHREGYPEIGMYYEKAAWEEAEHAAKFAELLGEVVSASTKHNLTVRIEAENGATLGKTDLAKRAKMANLDAIHDTVHEMARDEARHGKAFAGLLARYFK